MWDWPKNQAWSLLKEMDYLAWRRFVWWNHIPTLQLGRAALHTKNVGVPIIRHKCVSGRSYQRESLTKYSRAGPANGSHLVKHKPPLALDMSLLPVRLSREYQLGLQNIPVWEMIDLMKFRFPSSLRCCEPASHLSLVVFLWPVVPGPWTEAWKCPAKYIAPYKTQVCVENFTALH